MPKIIIADAVKPSVVMTSEIVKDTLTGVEMSVVGTGKECIELANKIQPDLCIVDFDLPDADGVAVIHLLKKNYNGPILLTAFPNQEIRNFIESELLFFRDAYDWTPKPVVAAKLAEKLTKFLTRKERLEQRFHAEVSSELKLSLPLSTGKKAPKAKDQGLFKASLRNISMTGARLELLTLPNEAPQSREITITLQSDKKSKTNHSLANIKAEIAWMTASGECGISFKKLSIQQKKELEALLKNAKPA